MPKKWLGSVKLYYLYMDGPAHQPCSRGNLSKQKMDKIRGGGANAPPASPLPTCLI